MSTKFVNMIHKVSGETISGVHPDAVPAHEAIGWVVVLEAEKTVEPALATHKSRNQEIADSEPLRHTNKAAKNDTAWKTPRKEAVKAAKNDTAGKMPQKPAAKRTGKK
jgi:hypothetical protein